MPKKNEAPASFEKALSELEQIVTRLEVATCRWKRR